MGAFRQEPDQVIVRAESYRSLPHICESDHKPVVAELAVEMPAVNLKRKRSQVVRILKMYHESLSPRFVRLSFPRTCCYLRMSFI